MEHFAHNGDDRLSHYLEREIVEVRRCVEIRRTLHVAAACKMYADLSNANTNPGPDPPLGSYVLPGR
jgi:hypothetical protein